MKLSVVCSESRLELLPGLREVLDELYVESRAWYDRPDLSIKESLETLEHCLEYSKYVLCILNTEDFTSTRIYYTLGYQRGRTDRTAFWIMPDQASDLPDWAAGFAVIPGSAKDVYEYYSEVVDSWSEETNEFVARREINELNLEVSARTFIETVQNGDRFLVGLFLESGFSPSLRDSSGVPILNHAIRSGHFDLVRPLLDAGADLNSKAEDRGTTPIMEAAACGREELVTMFIELKAELSHASRDGQTAVILAVGNGHDAAAIALIEGGADVDIKDMLGMSARKYAALYTQQAILQAIDANS